MTNSGIYNPPEPSGPPLARKQIPTLSAVPALHTEQPQSLDQPASQPAGPKLYTCSLPHTMSVKKPYVEASSIAGLAGRLSYHLRVSVTMAIYPIDRPRKTTRFAIVTRRAQLDTIRDHTTPPQRTYQY